MKKQIAVEWQVLLDDDAWDDDEAVVPPPPAQTTRPVTRPVTRSVREVAGLLSLLLALIAYGLWSSASVFAAQGAKALSVRPALSADRLAAASRQVILTEHLCIHAAGVDVATVQASAAALEGLYVETFAAVGAPLVHGAGAPDGRFVVLVEGDTLGEWDAARGAVSLPSPALQAPGAGRWSNGDLLRQSWAIALAERAAREAGAIHDVPEGWQPLLGGLRLWLLWRAGGPLAEGREEIVAWRYGETGATLSDARRFGICETFALWQRTPLDFGLPLLCGSADDSDFALTAPPTTMAELGLPEAVWTEAWEEQPSYRASESSSRSLALALLIEETVDSYGPESLPRLLAALAEHDSWETLIPAVYGVDIAYFVLRISYGGQATTLRAVRASERRLSRRVFEPYRNQ